MDKLQEQVGNSRVCLEVDSADVLVNSFSYFTDLFRAPCWLWRFGIAGKLWIGLYIQMATLLLFASHEWVGVSLMCSLVSLVNTKPSFQGGTTWLYKGESGLRRILRLLLFLMYGMKFPIFVIGDAFLRSRIPNILDHQCLPKSMASSDRDISTQSINAGSTLQLG